MSVRLSAGGLGFNSFSSSLARMKLSIGVLGHEESFTCGTADLDIGCQAQCFLLESAQAVCAAVATRGSGAPTLTQATMSAIWLSERCLPFVGIRRSGSGERTALSSRLLSGSPG